MLIKILKITKGIIDVDLGEYNIKEFSLANVTFHSDEPEYKIVLQKYGRHKSKKLKVTNISPVDMIYYFTLYRDGFTGLELSASIDGTFMFEFNRRIINPNIHIMNTQYDTIVANSKCKHYSQYFKIDNNAVIINETCFKNYTHSKHDIQFMELYLAHITTIGTNKSYISRKYDILFGFEINSKMDTKCIIYVNMTNTFEIDIKEGCHYYPLFLIVCALYFCSIEIKFDNECIDNIMERGIILDSNTLSLFKSKRIISHNENGIMYDYTNGLLSI
jgi:hypothetical protein